MLSPAIDSPLLLPALPLVALVISFFCSTAGVSGAFLLLPFQVSVLGVTGPTASPTNLIYNIVAIPGGVVRFIREGRMAWPLAGIIAAGTVPGVFLGAVIRVTYLPDPRNFKFFVGWVLLAVGLRLLHDLSAKWRVGETGDVAKANAAASMLSMSGMEGTMRPAIRTTGLSWTRYTFTYNGAHYSIHPMVLLPLSGVVGVIGGTYGIGGGAILAPVLVTFFGLPVYSIAGATLLGTFLTSVVGVVFYTFLAPLYAHAGLAVAPDWALGALFGVGGFLGIYCGARLQKHLPARTIKIILTLAVLFIAARYILGRFLA